eukprot:c9648_g1_i2.p1 GENE.c9648_g1_i2~~c9648_g1_i2.p1  ORF type:complete len:167 (-),score=32.09 c9648_g1_i2:2-502(-)
MSVLSLSGKQLKDDDVVKVCHTITSEPITHLSLSWNYISDKGARHIATALTSERCKLTHLDLNANMLSVSGVSYIATAIESGQCKLTELYLYANAVPRVVSSVLTHAVNNNRSLRTVAIESVESPEWMTCDELKSLLSLSSHCRWPNVVQLNIYCLIDRISSIPQK